MPRCLMMINQGQTNQNLASNCGACGAGWNHLFTRPTSAEKSASAQASIGREGEEPIKFNQRKSDGQRKEEKKLVDVRFILFTKRVGIRTKMEVTMWPLVCSPPRQVSRCFHFGKRLPAFLPIRPIIISPPPYPLSAVLQRLQCHATAKVSVTFRHST